MSEIIFIIFVFKTRMAVKFFGFLVIFIFMLKFRVLDDVMEGFVKFMDIEVILKVGICKKIVL